MKISVFRNLFNSKETPYELTIQEVANRIKKGTPELIEKIEKIRSLDHGTDEYKKLKNSLYAMVSLKKDQIMDLRSILDFVSWIMMAIHQNLNWTLKDKCLSMIHMYCCCLNHQEEMV
jgi:hypothetical protein